jgi:hypothetical protein
MAVVVAAPVPAPVLVVPAPVQVVVDNRRLDNNFIILGSGLLVDIDHIHE